MKAITDRAGERLVQALNEADAAPEQRVRLVLLLRGMELRLDEERSGDEVVAFRDRKVLVADADTGKKWGERTLDYEDEKFQFV
jgi:hypothetical protein